MRNNELSELLKNLENLEDEDARYSALFKAVDYIYREQISTLDNADFEVDPEGMKHFTEFSSFMSAIARENNGRVEFDIHEPRENKAGITVYLRVFWLSGAQLREFCKLLVWASAWSIDALLNGTV